MASTLPALIDVETLAGRLGDPGLRIFDATAALIRPPGGGPYEVESRRAQYRRAHVPGAAFADTPGELSDPRARLPFAVPDGAYFGAGAGALGIGDHDHVVVYAQSSPMWATRLWWLLRYFGHQGVSVLDGGLPAWLAAGLPTESGERRYRSTEFHARPRPELLAGQAEVLELVERGDEICLLNALRPEVFRGEGISSYSRPGRIPRSRNLPYTQLLDPDSGRFLPIAAIRQSLTAAGALDSEPVIAYCGGGISATVDLFGLYLAGRGDARLYDGSLAEWSADPRLPMELG